MRARVTSFAISRAGAIAAIVANGRRRALPTTVGIALLVSGSITVGIGAALTLSTGLGPGPFDVLLTGISNQTGVPFAGALWICAGVLAVAAVLLGGRPGPGTIAAPIIIGPVVQALIEVLDFVPELLNGPVGISLLVLLHLFGVGTIGIGAGAMIASGLGTGTGDLVAMATSNRLGRSTVAVRTLLELAWLGIGLTLGGTAGVGTILVALTIGRSVGSGHRIVESVVERRLSRFVPQPAQPEQVALSA